MWSFSHLRPDGHRRNSKGLSLIEMMVVLAIVLILLAVVLQLVTAVEQSWKSSASDPFAGAENAFEEVSRHLAGATLETYQDYVDSSGAFRTNAAGGFVPDHLARKSDLDFVCGPSGGPCGWLSTSGRVTAGNCVFIIEPAGFTQTEANAGLGHLLNGLGYFVEFGDETGMPSFLSSHRWRWRLKEVEQVSEALQVASTSTSAAWIQELVPAGAPVSELADNVIALVVLPERGANDSGAALSADFRYDSRDATNPLTRHQLPVRLRLALMAIDETSARILAEKNGATAPALVPTALFQRASQLDADLGELETSLTSQKIGHRLFQRTILLPAAAWSDRLSQ